MNQPNPNILIFPSPLQDWLHLLRYWDTKIYLNVATEFFSQVTLVCKSKPCVRGQPPDRKSLSGALIAHGIDLAAVFLNRWSDVTATRTELTVTLDLNYFANLTYNVCMISE